MRTVAYPHPGEILKEEFLDPMNVSQYALAKAISVSQTRIGEIVAGQRSISADTALRLSRFFGVSDEFWSSLQMDFDLAQARDLRAAELAQISPLARSA